MRWWITTDTHFNHEAIKKYCDRPDDCEKRILKGFEVIKSQDILIHLGDICIGNDAEVHERHINPIKCRKILVRGNHDRKSTTWYLTHGWDFVCEKFSLKRCDKQILFSHWPLVWDGYYDINFHGHFHNANHRRYEAERKEDMLSSGQRLLALEYNHYQLFNLDTQIHKNL